MRSIVFDYVIGFALTGNCFVDCFLDKAFHEVKLIAKI